MQNIVKITKEKRDRSHKRIRAKISGSAKRPRLSVFKSNNYIYAQAIDDENQKTLVSASDLEIKDIKGKKTEKSAQVAQKLAEKLKAKKIDEIVFDRGGFKYHGRIKILAEELRKLGIKF
ncbi:MAG: 50S ribosomal protein L18 [Candidatus Paceibacterota bacterium]|jgi:large subunit ribosomal protein L18